MICKRCGRKLKDPVSVQLGYGPTCREILGITQGDLVAGGRRVPSSRCGYEDGIPGQIDLFSIPKDAMIK